MVISAIVLSALLAARDTGAAPQPSSSPLKTIIEIRTRALCRTIAEHVQHALFGLIKNDRMIDLSVSVLDKTASDLSGGGSLGLDMLQLKNVALALNRNDAAIDKILDDPAHFPLHPTTPDELAEDKIKQDLLAILSRQKLVVNALYGTADTRDLASMQNDFPDHNPVVNPTAAPMLPADQALTLISSAGLQDTHVIDLVKVADSSLLGRTLYGQLAGLIVLHQRETQPYEMQTADDVREPAAECAN